MNTQKRKISNGVNKKIFVTLSFSLFLVFGVFLIAQAGDRWCGGIKCGPECTDWDYCVWDSATYTEKCPSKCPSSSGSISLCSYTLCQYSNPTLPCKCGTTNTAQTPNVYCCAAGNNGGGITASSKSICEANCGIECQTDADCSVGYACSNNKCVKKTVTPSTPTCTYGLCQYSNATLPCKCGASNTATSTTPYCCASGNNGGGIAASSKSICYANCGIECATDAECNAGYICSNNKCVQKAPTPITPTCDSVSHTSLASAFEFTSSVSAKYNMCGNEQYYKMTIPSGQKCDLSWTVTPDSNSDYDLFVEWSAGSFPSKNSYDAKSTNSTGKTDSLSKTQLSSGTYYVLVFKDSGTGGYTMSVSMSNCASITPPSAPTLTLSANPVQVSSGSSSVLTWSSANTTSCSASTSPSNAQWSGSKSLSGSQTITNIIATATLSLTCTGTGGSATQSVIVSVITPTPTGKITVISPNGGETWRAGETRRITWTYSGVNSIKIYIVNDKSYGSGSTNYILPNNIPISAGQGYYDWQISSLSQLPGGGGDTYKIRIEDSESPIIQDYSDNYFSIVETTTPICDSASYASYDKVCDFGNSGGTKSNMCGKYQYYKVFVPSEKTCDIGWTLTSDSRSDYDLFIKKDGEPASAKGGYDYISECPARNCITKTDVDKISKTNLPAGIYNALVQRDRGSGGYSIVVVVSNCKSATPEPLPAPPILIPGTLIKLADDFKVYLAIDSKKLWIPSIKVFNAMKLDWTKIQIVGKEEFNKYSEVKLIQAQKGINVYLLVNGQFRRHIPTEAIFKSYGYKWEDIIELEPTVVEAFPESQLLQLEGDYKVYKLEGVIKKWIKTAQAFEKLGFDWSMISIINKTEFDFYSTGDSIE